MELNEWKDSITKYKQMVEEGYKNCEILVCEASKKGINILGINGGILENKILVVGEHFLMDSAEIKEELIEKNCSKISYNLILNFYGNIKFKKHDKDEGIAKLITKDKPELLARIIEEDVDYHEIVYGPTWYRKIELNKNLDDIWMSYSQKGLSEDLICKAKNELNEWILENPAGKMDTGIMGVPERMDYL